MRCETYPLNTLGAYRYVVVLSVYGGRLMLSRHKERLPAELTYPDITPVPVRKAAIIEAHHPKPVC